MVTTKYTEWVMTKIWFESQFWSLELKIQASSGLAFLETVIEYSHSVESQFTSNMSKVIISMYKYTERESNHNSFLIYF